MIQKFQCPRCEHTFTPRVNTPSKCPRCQVLFIRDSNEQSEENIRILRIDVKKPRVVTVHE